VSDQPQFQPTITRRRRVAHLLLAAALAGCALLLRFPPERYGFYPQCPIHQYLHLECPGCGATRALAALLRGRINEALHLNALFVLLLPFALVFAVTCYRRALAPVAFRWPRFPAPAIFATVALAASFMLARNWTDW
jgi:Protein of unknown function (DUF2752)